MVPLDHLCLLKQSPLDTDGPPLNSSVNLSMIMSHAQPLPFSCVKRWHYLASFSLVGLVPRPSQFFNAACNIEKLGGPGTRVGITIIWFLVLFLDQMVPAPLVDRYTASLLDQFLTAEVTKQLQLRMLWFLTKIILQYGRHKQTKFCWSFEFVEIGGVDHEASMLSALP